MSINSLIVMFDLNIALDAEPEPPDLALSLEEELFISSVSSILRILVSSTCFVR